MRNVYIVTTQNFYKYNGVESAMGVGSGDVQAFTNLTDAMYYATNEIKRMQATYQCVGKANGEFHKPDIVDSCGSARQEYRIKDSDIPYSKVFQIMRKRLNQL